MIRILLDQNEPEPIAAWLQERVGEAAEVTSTRQLGFQRMADDELFFFCRQQKMVVITYDEDFQNPLLINDIPGYGVVRLNVYPAGIKQTREALQRPLDSHTIASWEHASIVVDQHKIRHKKR